MTRRMERYRVYVEGNRRDSRSRSSPIRSHHGGPAVHRAGERSEGMVIKFKRRFRNIDVAKLRDKILLCHPFLFLYREQY